MTTSYATLADFTSGFEAAAPSAARSARIDTVLAQASRMIDAAAGHGFLRHPASGTASRVHDGPGGDTLHVHGGIVSLTEVAIAADPDLAYVALPADDWYLAPLSPETGEPFDHLVLAEGRGRLFPAGQRRVRLTGVFGFAVPPPAIVAATVALARQLYRADSTVPGGVAGPDEWSGAETMPRGWPDAAYRAVAHYRARFRGCYV